jgi:hypothetical protein
LAPDVTESACRNCAAPLNGQFCARCGQRALPPHPTVRELVGDAYGELAGWDGKFVQTVRLLVQRPGLLTQDVIEGRRARYLSPVRLYLMCSVLYFLISAGVPRPDVEFEVGAGVDLGISDTVDSTPGQMALGRAIDAGISNLTPAERALAEAEIAAQPRVVRPMLEAMARDYQGLMRRASETMPRVLFALIPALAVILALFHRGRHFPEHVYFALHFEAFIFLVLILVAAVQYVRWLPALVVAQGVAAVWIVAYGVVAQRRVYGSSWTGAVAKSIGVGVLFLLLWSTAVSGVTLWVSQAA